MEKSSKYWMNLCKLCLLAAVCAISVVPLAAQISGDIKGVVLDASGASVPQAAVTITSLETGESREMQADGQGRFVFNLLKIGPYEVKAAAPGFRSSMTQATVRSGEIASVKFVLELGPVTETVTVTDAVNPLDNENAQVQISVLGEPIQNIPVVRNPNIFATLAPGVIPVTSNNPFLGSGSFNVNGGRGRGNNITVDGITATDISVTGTGGVLGPLSFSQIQEVKLITHNFSAEYGRNANSQLLYVTKSGTNRLRGELYDYFQNDKLNSRPFFDRTGERNIVRFNQWGYAAGGLVFVPGLYDGRNRTFFFQTYEGNKIRGAGATRIAQVPTADLISRVTDPAARSLLEQARLPLPTTIGAGFGQVEQSAGIRADAYQTSVKIDHQVTSRDRLSGRYARFVSSAGASDLTFVGTNLANFGASSVNEPQQASLTETHVFSPTVVNEFRFGFGRSRPSFPINSTVPLGPRVRFLNGQIDSFGVFEGLPQGRTQNAFQWSDTLSWVRGPHSFKFGAEVFRYQANSFFDAFLQPRIDFASFDDFAAGRPFQVIQRFGHSVRGNRVTNQFYFVQDDWKISRDLTVNLGLRAEVAGGVSEVNGVISNLDLNAREPLGQAGTGPFGAFTAGQRSFDTNINWGPRFGFAWNPFGDRKTVIRGGYGISHDFIFLNPITNQRFLPPFIITASLVGQENFTGPNSLANILAGTSLLQQQARAQVGSISQTALNFGNISPAIDTNLRNPQVQQFSFGVQREFFGGVALKASYVGAKGNFLQRTRPLNLLNDPRALPAASLQDETARLNDFRAVVTASTGNPTRFSNRIDPRFNEINLLDSSANSIYHSFQAEAERRFSRGYQFRVAYTFGKSIDDVSDSLGVLINDSAAQQNPLDNRDNRAVSQFDVPQRLVVTHVWEPTWGHRIANPFLRRLANGWGFAGITSFRDGFPVTLEAGARRGISPLSLTGLAAGSPVRPNASGPFAFNPAPAGRAGAPSGLNADTIQPISSYAAGLGLSQPLIGNFGTLGRNTHRLNGQTNFDWNAYKNIAIREGLSLQVRAEFYNVFNNTSFQDVNRNISNSAFGQYTTVATDARNMQVALRLIF